MAYESREVRKARLAEATWAVIVREGIGAVSVRTVATEAGMAVGSLRHLFPTQAELLEFSAELMVERASARITATIRGSDSIEYAVAVIKEVLPLEVQTRREFEVNLALIAASPANPELTRIRNEAHERLGELFVRIVMMLRAEYSDVELSEPTGEETTAARRLHALVDGIGLHLLHTNAESDGGWALELIRGELEAVQKKGASGA